MHDGELQNINHIFVYFLPANPLKTLLSHFKEYKIRKSKWEYNVGKQKKAMKKMSIFAAIARLVATAGQRPASYISV